MFANYFYRIYDTGIEINLDFLERELPLGGHTLSRSRLSRVRTKSIQMEVRPLLIRLGNASVAMDGQMLHLAAQARIYDIGAISICLSYEHQPEDAVRLEDIALALGGQQGLDEIFEEKLVFIQSVLKPFYAELEIDTQFYEDYNIYHIHEAGQVEDPLPVLMGENADFSGQMREDLAGNYLSYSTADYAIITWDTALICDPEPPGDLRDLIEFANVQLLELRYYDKLLTQHMDRMYEHISLAEKKGQYWRLRQYRKIMTILMELIADITAVTEKIDNLIKITEDVYYARVYRQTLKVLRTAQWTDSVQRKLSVIQQNYTLLSNAVNVQHSNFLEWIIIILIALEFGFAIFEAVL